MRITRIITGLSVLALMAMFTVSSASAGYYVTSFEEPVFSTGLIHGQDGWVQSAGLTGGATGDPQNSEIKTQVGGLLVPEGSQYLHHQTGGTRVGRQFFGATLTDYVNEEFTVSVLLAYTGDASTTGTPSVWITNAEGATVGGSLSGLAFGFNVVSGVVQAYARGGSTTQLGAVAADTWYLFDATINPATGWSITVTEAFGGQNFIGGTAQSTFRSAGGFTNEINAIAIHNSGTQASSMFIDDLQIIPEPASLALIGLGGLLMLRRQRQQG